MSMAPQERGVELRLAQQLEVQGFTLIKKLPRSEPQTPYTLLLRRDNGSAVMFGALLYANGLFSTPIPIRYEQPTGARIYCE